MSKYVIITPAKDEEQHIEKTIQSMLSQTVKPKRWVIVDDGSRDRTAEIVQKYLVPNEFIFFLKMEASDRNFASKVAAFNAGLELLKGTEYSFIGNLDADVCFAPDYYANIIAEFEKNTRLGIAGGAVYTRIGRKFVNYDAAPDSVSGQVQLFRKECFDQIGGYLPLELGGEDAATEIMARMKGWTVRKFAENRVWEHRRAGFAKNGALVAMYKRGMRFHLLGYSTVFYVLRSVYRLMDSPPFIGSALALLGFMVARLSRHPIQLPLEAVRYLRSEQMKKLRLALFGKSTWLRRSLKEEEV